MSKKLASLKKANNRVNFSTLEKILVGTINGYTKSVRDKKISCVHGAFILGEPGIGKTSAVKAAVRKVLGLDKDPDNLSIHTINGVRTIFLIATGAAFDPDMVQMPIVSSEIKEEEIQKISKSSAKAVDKEFLYNKALNSSEKSLKFVVASAYQKLINREADALVCIVDDLTRAGHPGTNNFFKALFDRSIGTEFIGQYPCFISTGNPEGQINDLDSAFCNSLPFYYVEIDEPTYLKNMHKWNHPLVCKFLEKHPGYVYVTGSNIETMQPCPRMWELVSSALTEHETDTDLIGHIFAAHVGDKAAHDFVKFFNEVRNTSFSAQFVLSSPAEAANVLLQKKDCVAVLRTVMGELTTQILKDSDTFIPLNEFSKGIKANQSLLSSFLYGVFLNPDEKISPKIREAVATATLEQELAIKEMAELLSTVSPVEGGN